MTVPISDNNLWLPEPFTEPPGNVFELAEHIRLDPGLVRDELRSLGIDLRFLDERELVHISSLHEAAPGSDEERLKAVVRAWRDFTGKSVEELEDPDEPTGELQIEELCEKHGFDLDTFVADISCYGYFHLACPECGSVSLRQIQWDRVDEAECRHRVQYIYYCMPKGDVLVEYIPDEWGSDDDPPEVALECRRCSSRWSQSDLVVASQAHSNGYPEFDHDEDAEATAGEDATLDGDELLGRLEGLRIRALHLRDEIGAVRRATSSGQLVEIPEDAYELRKLLWAIEEHADDVAVDVTEVRAMLKSDDQSAA